MRKPLLSAAAALLLLGPAAAPAGGAEPLASLPDIEDEVMCPICGTSLEQSQSPQAERERELIRRLIAQGRDKEEIKDALVAEYGPDVLAVPDDEGFDLTAWLVPIGGFAVALGAVALALRRARRSPSRQAPPLSDEDSSRLDRDMSSYDL